MNRAWIIGAVAALCIALCGCGRGDAPADVTAFASADDKALASCDFRLLAAVADMAAGVDANLPGAHVLAAIDTSSVADIPALFKYGRSGAFAFLSLKDSKAFAKSVEETTGAKPEKDGRYEAYAIDGGGKVMVTSGFACFVPAGIGAGDVDSLIARAKEHPLVGWRKEAITRGNAANIICAMPERSQLRSLYGARPVAFTLSADIIDEHFSADASVRDADGNPMQMSIKERIDTSLLQYATAGADLVALAALPGGFDWRGLLAGTDLASLSPALAKTDGTQMVSYNTRTRNFAVAFELTPKAADKEMVYGEFYGVKRKGNTLIFSLDHSEEGGASLPGLTEKAYVAYVWARCANGPLNLNGDLWFDGRLLHADFTGKNPERSLKALVGFFL